MSDNTAWGSDASDLLPPAPAPEAAPALQPVATSSPASPNAEIPYNANDAGQRRVLTMINQGEGSPGPTQGVGYAPLSGYATDATGFPQWPGVPSPSAPGRTSHGAGSYQFEPATWNNIAQQHNLNFQRPEDQDAGAWYLAQQAYRQQTGGALNDAIQRGDYTGISQALHASGQWAMGGGSASGPSSSSANVAWPDAHDLISGTPTAQYQEPGGPPISNTPTPMATTIAMMEAEGLRDQNAPRGSGHNPEGQMPGEGPPPVDPNSGPGDVNGLGWYITPEGQIRKAGDPNPDYSAQFAASAQQRQQHPILSALGGAGQGLFWDQGAGADRMLGGALATPTDVPGGFALAQGYAGIFGGPSPQDLMSDARQGFNNERASYNLNNLGNTWSQVGRFTGQAVPATAAALAVPEAAPETLAGLGEGTLANMSRFGIGVATNATKGVAATATGVGANPNVPVATQLTLGGVTGAAIPGVVGATGRVGSALMGAGRTVSPDVAELAQLAMTKYGIPLRSGQLTGVGDKNARFADDVILQSDRGYQDNNAAQQQAFMRGITGTYGDTTGDVSPEALSAARDRLGQQFNDFATNHSVADVDSLQTRLSGIIQHAQQVLPEGEIAPLLRQVQNVGDVVSGTGPSRTISGQSYLSLTSKGSPLDRLLSSDDPNMRFYAGQIRDSLDDAIAQSATPEEQAAFTNTRLQYKNLQTVAKLAPKADVEGSISPALLRGAVNSTFKKTAFQGAGDLGELAQIGQTFLKPPPNSGSVNRAQAVLGPWSLGLGGAGEAVAGTLAALGDPHALPVAALSAAGVGGKAAVTGAAKALQRARLNQGVLGIGSPQAIINNSVAAQTPRSALSAVISRPLVPLSALSGSQFLNGSRVQPALGTSPVGANAQ